MVNAASEDKLDQIWTFIEYMTAPESSASSRCRARCSRPEGSYEDQEVLDRLPVARLGRESPENARPRPVSPYYSDMSLAMAEQFNAALKGEVPVRRSLETLKGELQSIVDQG